METNKITVAGKIKDLKFSHNTKGEDFYEAIMEVVRTSGTSDYIPCILPKNIFEKVCNNGYYTFIGSVRTRNETVNDRRKVLVYVFVDACREYAKDINELEFDGWVCKASDVRTTPFGRKITDIVMAVHRLNGKSDYLPCVFWGRNAERVSTYDTGSNLGVKGRLQSRDYLKRYEDGTEETKTAYEVSVCWFGEMGAFDNEEEIEGNC